MQPQLDSIRVFRKTVVKTVTVTNTVETKKKSKPFGIGVQLGYFFSSINSSPYAEIGILYKLIRVQAGYTFTSNKLTPYTKIGISYSPKTF